MLLLYVLFLDVVCLFIFTHYMLIRINSCLFNGICNMWGGALIKLARISFIFAREIRCNGGVIQNELSSI